MSDPDPAANPEPDNDGPERPATGTGGDRRPDSAAAVESPAAAEAAPEEAVANPADATARSAVAPVDGPAVASPPVDGPADAVAPVDGPPVPSAPQPATASPTESLPAAPTSVAAPEAGLRPYRVLIGIGAALALVLMTALVFITYNDVAGAEARVLSYYDSLSSNDGESAGELLKDVHDDLLDGDSQLHDRISDSPFWDNPTLAHGYSPPSEVEVVSGSAGVPPGVRPKPEREYAFVTVGYSVAGRPASESFGLERKPEGAWTIITAAVGSFYVGDSWLGYEILGEWVDDLETDDSVAAPPGAYEVSVADHEIFEDSRDDIAVTPGLNGHYGASSSLSTSDFKVRPDALAEVRSQVESLIDTCATGDGWDLDTPACPWSGVEPDEAPEELDGLWKVTAYPEIDIVVGFFGQAVVRTVEPGSAVNEEFDITADLVPKGRVAVENGEVVWHSNEELRRRAASQPRHRVHHLVPVAAAEHRRVHQQQM